MSGSEPTVSPAASTPASTPASTTVSLAGTIRKQRRVVVLAAVLAVGAFWVGATLGRWEIGVFVAVGVGLGLLNGLLTELTLARAVASGELPTRKQYALTSLVRLMAISVVALAFAVVFWPDGGTVLLGLALFHLITLTLTGIPLLKELRKA
jgi:hypothetical protein